MNAAAHDMLTGCQSFHRSSHAPRPGITARIAATIATWRHRVRDRHAFADLNYRDLRDLRMSQWEVERELAKPFWRG